MKPMTVVKIIVPGILLLFLFSCSTAPKGSDGKELHKKLYLDANLEFTLTVPDDWSRRFLPATVGSPATYAVLWQSPVDKENPDIEPAEIRVDLLSRQTSMDEKSLAGIFQLSHPGFNSTAVRRLEGALFTTVELLGHTSARSYQVFFIQAPKQVYQISFSSAPEQFAPNQQLFKLVFGSFVPLE